MSQAPWDTWGTEVPPGTTASDLAEGIERVTEELAAAAGSVTEGTFNRPGTFDKWSAKDALAHCLAWSEICSRVVSELAAGVFDPKDYAELDDDEDELNERQVAGLSDVSTDGLLARLREAGSSTARALRTLDGDPPSALLYATVIDHFPEHASEFLGLER